ncbi:hypothetical protein BH10BAC3_BH10BAC3_09630 [soil metagenome]
MKKIYALFLLALPFSALHSQIGCPIIYGAFINSCGQTEGLNELVVFNTTTQTAVSNYVLSYGTVNPPAGNSPSGILSGANAIAKNGPGVITSLGGCTLTYVTSPATVIPVAATVVFIPSNFDNNFNISPFCTTGTVSVVLIDITAAPSTWNSNGTLANSPNAARFIQVANGGNACTIGVRTYSDLWDANNDGNFVGWDLTGTATYANLGCDLITVPVKLLSFTAVGAGKNANVAWQTSSEVNTKNFELQRSADGANFSAVFITAAAGHSSTVKNYAFTDLNIVAGPSYYRLKMVDMDGTVTYSKIARVVTTRNGFIITNVYPTPAASQLSITFNAPRAGKTTANVYDLAGRILISKQVATASGMNYYQLPVSQLPIGSYMLKLVNDGETVVSQFTKQ